MSARVVAPLVFPVRPGMARTLTSRAAARRLVVPRLAAARQRASSYAMAAVEERGRIVVHGLLLQALGWDSATAITLREQSGSTVVTAGPENTSRLSRRGLLHVPVTIRRWCGLTPGSRVLLVADADMQRLVVHPTAVLDDMVTRWHAEAFGGEPS